MKNPNLPFDTKNFYNKHGFNLLKNIYVKEIKKIKEEIHNYLIYFGKRNKLINGNENYDDLVQKIMIPGSKLRTFIYDSVPLLNSIQDLKRNNYIRKHLHKLGFKNPVAFDMGTVRFDINKKEETKFLRGIHQDIRSIKTKKTVTVWIPLVEVNNINGTVVIYPGTQNYGLLNHIYDPNLLIPEDQLPKKIKYLDNDGISSVKQNDIIVYVNQEFDLDEKKY